MESFSLRLQRATAERGPLCVGLDPAPQTLHSWGLADTVQGLEQFSQRCVEAAHDLVACIKPQVAFFERFGSQGFAILEQTIRTAREAGLLVIADAKRSDISTTAAAYGAAWFGETAPLAADALTVTPYLGLHALQPIFEQAQQANCGVFVVVSSSNPEGRELQLARVGSATVEEALYGAIGELNAAASEPYLGAVLGATRPFDREPVSKMSGPLLIPGLGAQGATPQEVGERFSSLANTLVVAVSRAWTDAGPLNEDLRARASELQQALHSALS